MRLPAEPIGFRPPKKQRHKGEEGCALLPTLCLCVRNVRLTDAGGYFFPSIARSMRRDR